MREIKFRGKGVGKSLTLGSLFDGIAGFPLSASKVGIKAVWASEIEPWPIKVTEKHFPGMAHLGDLTKINGTEIPPVDVITFGSPCQDFSVAGKRAGLEGQRSGLFMEAVRIIREMREATYGTYPRFAVWENVPGAFSSNRGEDFRAVLEEIAEAEIPMPRSGKWATAGMVRTERVDVAWRVLDAQHWGVPQRRRRIFLVADFGGECAGEILFERQSVSGNPAESRKAGQKAAGGAGDGAEATGRIENIGTFQNTGQGWWNESDTAATIRTPCGGDSVKVNLVAQLYDMTHAEEVMRPVKPGLAPTLNSRMGTGGNQVPVMLAFAANQRDEIRDLGDKSGALQAEPGMKQQMFVARTLTSRNDGSPCIDRGPEIIIQNYAVRRLTPLECTRLQGFPDDWLDIEGMSDTAKYKAIGNSVAVPCVEFVMAGIARVMREEVTHADRH